MFKVRARVSSAQNMVEDIFTAIILAPFVIGELSFKGENKCNNFSCGQIRVLFHTQGKLLQKKVLFRQACVSQKQKRKSKFRDHSMIFGDCSD